MTDLRLQVDGVPFSNFLSFTISRSIETFAGSFSFTATDADRKLFPIKLGSKVRATINDHPILTGWVEAISPSIDAGSHSVDIQGRDVTNDIIDSTLNAGSVELNPPVTLEDIINKVQTAIGTKLKIKNNVPGLAAYTPEEIASCKAGDGGFAFLEKFARTRQVLLNTDGSGNITISRNSKDRLAFSLINRKDGKGNNILSSSAKYDNSQRFNKYFVVSQSNLVGANDYGIPDLDELVATISAPVVDSAIRSSRIMYLNAETNASSGQAKDRAVWEMNVRKARSRTYSAKVDGITVPGTKDPFPINRLVQVDDEAVGISSTMLIKSVTLSVSGSGEETSLELVDKDAYTLETSEPGTSSRSNVLGEGFDE